MNWKAKWIWDSGDERPRNYWLCFRKTFNINKSYDRAVINITADSRYFLYLNGRLIGNGPARYWPFEMIYDKYEIQDYLEQGTNTISVLVNHYGVSTSQYVEGKAGLICQADFYIGQKTDLSIISDSTWKNHVHDGYLKKDIRINFSQSWIEKFNAGNFSGDWNKIEYDDCDWVYSKEIGGYGAEPWGVLVERKIPFLTNQPVYPERIVSQKLVKSEGQHICLNFREKFYPENYDCSDKIQLGYLFSVIKSRKKCIGKIKLITRKYPLTTEKIKINNREYFFSEKEDEIDVMLNKGENLFIMDISGCYQKFNVDLLFKFDCDLKFSVPGYDEKNLFLSVGPFDYSPVLNIVATDNIDVDWNNPNYKAFWEISSVDGLKDFKDWINPVGEEFIETDNVFIMSSEKKEIKRFSPGRNEYFMITPDSNYCVVAPGTSGDMEYIIDFGKELSGYLEFDIYSEKGVILDFNFFEYISMNSTELCAGMNNTLRYIAAKGRQTYRSLVRRGSRYVMLTVRNRTGETKIFSIKMIQSNFPVVNVGKFTCSDFLLNNIWEISKQTVKLCLEDTFVDCPAYEQAFWVGDARHTALINYYTFGESMIHEHSLEFAAKSLKRSELPEAVVPTGSSIILTTWSMLWLISCREYFEFTGDLDFIKRIYGYMEKMVESLLEYINDRNLFEICAWNMLDWAQMDNPSDGIITHQNVMLVKVLADMEYLSKVIGKEGKAYLTIVNKLKKSINLHLWDDERQAFIDCIYPDGIRSKVISIQTNIMVYLYDCVQGRRKKIVSKYIENIPLELIQIGSPFMSFFYYEALMKEQKVNKMLDDIREKWGKMLESGATTCWETFEGFTEGRLTRSHCHAWSAAPAYFLGAYVLGIRPAAPGYSRVIIEPCISNLTWAEGSVPTPKGRIDMSWKIGNEGISITVCLPESMEYELLVPDEYKKKCKVEIKKY